MINLNWVKGERSRTVEAPCQTPSHKDCKLLNNKTGGRTYTYFMHAGGLPNWLQVGNCLQLDELY